MDPTDPPLVFIGDISVGRRWVTTPYGWTPTRGSTWHVNESVFYRDQIPQWAIITAIVTSILCILGLLFLLVKEPVAQGYVDVTVMNREFLHTTRIYVNGPFQADQIRQQVAHVQRLVADAPEPA